jgi:hypothetical protein
MTFGRYAEFGLTNDSGADLYKDSYQLDALGHWKLRVEGKGMFTAPQSSCADIDLQADSIPSMTISILMSELGTDITDHVSAL